MRKAEVDHAWTECRKGQNTTLSITSVAVTENGEPNTLGISSRVAALIGANGAGKSGFLRGLKARLEGQGPMHLRPELTLVEGQFRGRQFQLTDADPIPPDGLRVELIDASLDAHGIQKDLALLPDLNAILAQYGERPATARELEIYKYVCGRDYTSVSISEIDKAEIFEASSDSDVERDEDVFPYFRVSAHGSSWDNSSMGFGELCACYLIWKLFRLDRGSVVLLDEPDSHLSPASRRAMLDIIAVAAKERDLFVIFTTHAVEPLHAMSEAEMMLIYSDVASVQTRIAPVSTKRHVIRALGLAPSKRLLITVEDVDAQEVVRQIVNRWGVDFSGSVDIQIVNGGATEVVRFQRLFPKSSGVCSAMAILDGDKREAFPPDAALLFLPTDKDPIDAAKSLVATDSERLAEYLGVSADQVRRAIGSIAHLNHHDFCADLLRELQLTGKTVPSIREALIRTWLSDEGVARLAQELATSISKLVDAIPLI